MKNNVVTLRFSGGGPSAPEFHFDETTPKVGEVLTRGSDEWVVVVVEDAKDGTTVVTLRPA